MCSPEVSGEGQGYQALPEIDKAEARDYQVGTMTVAKKI